MSNGCPKCGSEGDISALLTGRRAYRKPCEACGAELCWKCGHRMSAHEPMIRNPLRDECQICVAETWICGCREHGADIDRDFEFAPVALGELVC